MHIVVGGGERGVVRYENEAGQLCRLEKEEEEEEEEKEMERE